MSILAIETSGELCSVALKLGKDKYTETNIKMKHIHSEKLIPMIEHVFDELDYDIDKLDKIAVSNGPGSFTGLRIGMAAVKGISFGKNIPLVSVPTFEAMALQISSFIPAKATFSIVNNVNIDEVYFARFKSSNNSYETMDELKLVYKDEIDKMVDKNELVFGNYYVSDDKLSSPNAIFVAKWAELFGTELTEMEFEYHEPNYIKNFVAKVKK